MAKALVLFQLSVLLLNSFTVLSHGEWYSLDKNVDHLSPAQAPKPHKGHHHHPPKNSPAPSPVYPPTKSPAKSPTPPPAKPPTPPPAHSPSKPPAKPPVKPPAYSPSKPPAKPPVKPPAYSPSKPPAKPPVKPPSPSPSPSRKPVAVRGLVYCKPCKFRGVETLNQAKPLQGAVVEIVCKNTKKALVEQGTTDKNGFFWITPKHLTSGAYHKCRVFLLKSNTSSCDVPTNYNNGKSGAALKYTPLPKPPAPATIEYDVFTVGPFGFEPSKKVPCKK